MLTLPLQPEPPPSLWALLEHPKYLTLPFPASFPLLPLPQNVTKGARHKIALSIQKLRERQSVLKSLEKVRTHYPHLQGQLAAQWHSRLRALCRPCCLSGLPLGSPALMSDLQWPQP